MKRFLIIVCIFGCLALNNCGTPKKVDANLDKECLPQIESFFNGLKAGGYKASLEDLLESNPAFDMKDSSVLNLVLKFKNLNEGSGKYIQYKILKKRSIESDVAIYSCLAKYEIKFYRFIFIFYKATDRAVIYKFKFDDELDVELEASINMYLS
jgi:hypothetical protein